ncbi:unnamed protein product [Ceutorhynchus assimilis]|uniref:Enkurin domain-containing protein n=1 Tax=Ceutorhynchus assimilis TaxID=467358 RepID=A0A9N9MIS3_9CUCU|nr:unnamed protein product [Ceutorhynchus assimilis]
MQTEREEDLSRLYDTGVIKYPSPGVGRTSKQPPQTGQGDHLTKPQKSQLPQNYQRGVLPKYLRDRKEESAIPEPDNECPSGHVLLPEEERKETLRVLRQSYADRIQELNMMPVRNDTLKMKKRKMEIEEELKRIDGGIKVFQRPKVYVKINA